MNYAVSWAGTFALGVSMMMAADNWPQFRGPGGDGLAAAAVPVRWSESQSVRWKTAVHGKAWSSPVLWGDQIWVSTATEDGHELAALCLDRNTGKVLRDQKLFDIENPQFCHKFNSYASPTPVIEAGRIYVTFGAPGTACLDTATGKVLWERRDIECNHFRAAGSSPILDGDLLIMNFDGSNHQFILALDKNTGRTRWRSDRSLDYKDLGPDGKPEAEGDWRKAFATPHVAELSGVRTLLSQGAKAFYGYEPQSGRELWRIEERSSHSGGTRPVVGHGLVYFPTGWSAGFVLAVKPGKTGESLDVNASAISSTELNVAWKTKRNVPKKPALTLLGDQLFGIDDIGIATCWDAVTGSVLWSERIGGNYSASPIIAGGRIYFFSEEGKIVVAAAGPKFEKLAENQLEDGFMASAAVAGKALYLRSKSHLYRIED
ncbi:MAG: quinonprotein alcohol dehydrogenase [Pedosphaera sp.]|nr:quinonprotein alcohol dehydrogenase [Pedosphaera sp.]